LIAAKKTKNKREAKEPSGPLQESRVECSCVGSVTPHGISYQRAAREPYNHTCGRRARGHSKAYNARVGADTIHPRRRAGGSKHSAASAPHGQHKARKGQEYSPTRRPRLYCPPRHDSFPPHTCGRSLFFRNRSGILCNIYSSAHTKITPMKLLGLTVRRRFMQFYANRRRSPVKPLYQSSVNGISVDYRKVPAPFLSPSKQHAVKLLIMGLRAVRPPSFSTATLRVRNARPLKQTRRA
jgi:hypothetical protein